VKKYYICVSLKDTTMTHIELHQFQELERSLQCRPNLISGFMVSFVPQNISLTKLYAIVKDTVTIKSPIIPQLFSIVTKLSN
jgi:hypothetical protein